MDFELSDDQLALRDAAAVLLDARSGPAQVRAVVDAGGGYDAELWKAMVDQGWTGLLLGDDRGGLGLGPVEAAVLLEQLGAHLAPAPILQHLIAVDTELCAARASSFLDALGDGSRLGCVAFGPVESSGSGGEVRLEGRTEPVVYAPSADVVFVRTTGDGEHVVVVDLSEVEVDRQPAMDVTREVGWLQFDRTPATVVGDEDAVARFVDFGAMAYSAELLGLAQAALDLTVAYAKEREQFGRPIGSFQAVKHRCADMLVDVEGMRSAVYYAAWAIGADDRDASVAASTAKTWCSDAGRRVMASALQVHGGIGFTWEHDTHLYLKRAQLDEVSFGDARFHRARLARLLRERLDAGEPVI